MGTRTTLPLLGCPRELPALTPASCGLLPRAANSVHRCSPYAPPPPPPHFAGTRQLQQAMAGVGAMLPPGLTFLTQSAVAVLTYNSQDFAKTQVRGGDRVTPAGLPRASPAAKMAQPGVQC